eukprot:9010367-Alexandrium_andersonii.AAC.1
MQGEAHSHTNWQRPHKTIARRPWRNGSRTVALPMRAALDRTGPEAHVSRVRVSSSPDLGPRNDDSDV